MGEIPALLAEALRDRYVLERELGRGGMATVFLARDLKHKRPVALKVLSPELARSVGDDRFHREIEIAARLQHPHILTVYDSGETAGCLWFTMPYVRGESLRDRLRREGQLPVDEAIRISREALQALAYAHAQGVVHRDIKPENILLLEDGAALVADFGIARALAGGEEPLTQTGMTMGTPVYMSPEQAAGQAVDARSDLYSLACVCYEMLAGEPPYTGSTLQTIVAKRLSDPVPSVRRLRGSVPEAIDRVLQRALAPLAADRFAAATEFARALQPSAATAPPGVTGAPPATAASGATLGAPAPASGGDGGRSRRRVPAATIALGIGFAVGVGVLFAWRRMHPLETAEGRHVLAVLPFENLGDSSDVYFADGVTDEVRTKLSQIAGIEVIARGSSNEYRHTTKPLVQVARELGVDYLLTATVRWEKRPGGESRVRVTPELVKVSPGRAPRTKWGRPFDAALTDVFEVQADIAGKVAGALDIALADSTQRQLAARPTQNLAAYDALLRGDRLIVTEGRTDLASAREAARAYGEAIRLDSGFALAWARIARAEALRYGNGENSDSVGQAARQGAERALALAPNRAESHYATAYVRSLIDLDVRGAIEALERARTLAPGDADVLSLLAGLEGDLGRLREAAAYNAEAIRLDPRSLLLARRYGNALIQLRRFAEADSVAMAGLTLAPDNFDLINLSMESRLARGDVLGARQALRHALRQVGLHRLIRNVPADRLWVDDSVEALALRLPPSAYADDRAVGLFHLSAVQWQAGRYAECRASADSARPLLEAEIARHPANLFAHVQLAFLNALTGRHREALEEAERWRALARPQPNTYPWTLWAYVRFGIELLSRNAAGAVAWADTLVHLPGSTTREWLRIDPGYNWLRSDPGFQRLVAGK